MHVRVCVVSVARRGSIVNARSKTMDGFDTIIRIKGGSKSVR